MEAQRTMIPLSSRALRTSLPCWTFFAAVRLMARLAHLLVGLRRLRMRGPEGPGRSLAVDQQVLLAVPLQLGHVVGHVVDHPQVAVLLQGAPEDLAGGVGDGLAVREGE